MSVYLKAYASAADPFQKHTHVSLDHRVSMGFGVPAPGQATSENDGGAGGGI